MKDPNVWTLHELVRHCNDGTMSSSNDGKSWVPARPMGFASIPARLRATLLVFTGRADAVIWPQGQ